MDTIRDRLRWLLGAGELSAREASRLAGQSSPSHVGMFLRGDIVDSKTNTVGELATVLGVRPGWLAFGESPCIADRPELDLARNEDHPEIAAHVRAAVARARAAHAAAHGAAA